MVLFCDVGHTYYFSISENEKPLIKLDGLGDSTQFANNQLLRVNSDE